eukprot:Lithocolla_globosa_v1_NODE_1928_length_2255_cov_11.835984.p2 type:complete len:226 gc:universal NODE_1928_length_2255_cov_11.835984:279-956(+)
MYTLTLSLCLFVSLSLCLFVSLSLFANVRLSFFPGETLPLWTYTRHIFRLAQQYLISEVLQLDRHFRLLKSRSPTDIPWGATQALNELGLCHLRTPRKDLVRCLSCSQTGHLAAECALPIINRPPNLFRKQGDSFRSQRNRPTDSFRSQGDRHTEVCLNFNRGQCSYPCPQRRTHICQYCRVKPCGCGHIDSIIKSNDSRPKENLKRPASDASPPPPRQPSSILD